MNEQLPVIIVDDMTMHQEALRKKIELYCRELKVETQCSNISEAIEAIDKFHPVIVFLDIDLGSQNGFDLLKQLDEYDFRVIFVSAHSSQENLLKAIKISAAGFVTKPIDKDELVLAVHKVLNDVNDDSTASSLKNLVHNLSNPSPQ